MLDLPVHMGVHDCCPINPNVVIIAELEEFLACKQCAIICDDRVRHAKAVDNVKDKARVCVDLIVVIGLASIHFVNLSMATSKWVKPPGAFFKGPTMSSPQTANGHVMEIVCRARTGMWDCRA